MKYRETILRASHINTGTAIPRQELAWPRNGRRVLRHPKLRVSGQRGAETAYGGLALAAMLARMLRLGQRIEGQLQLLKGHRPYTEGDHVLAHVYNLFVGGECIEDMANLQQSEAIKRLLGAPRLPDPTTGGDFLRRFKEADLRALDAAIDEAQEQVWSKRYGRKKQPLATVDLDSTIKEVYGLQKEGADFSYKGSWSYHPLLITLAQTQECLRVINRPGNRPSAEGAVAQLRELFPLLLRHFRKVLVRGDSAFMDHEMLNECEAQGQSFAIVMGGYPNVRKLAENLPPRFWTRFRTKAERARAAAAPSGRRKRGRNRRRKIALQRRKRDLQLKAQWVAELPYCPRRSRYTYRLIIRKQRIAETTKQGELFDVWRYRFAVTNLRDASAEEVLDLTYERCDQENVIEQFGHGIAGLRMPTGTLLANAAYLCCARLAHNLKSWLCQLALPSETVRWKWKRFRHAFVYVAATVTHQARQVHVRLSEAHRYHRELLYAVGRLQC